jgi:hypothetical protein
MSQFLSQVSALFRNAGMWFKEPKHWVPVACGGVALIILIVLLAVYVPRGEEAEKKEADDTRGEEAEKKEADDTPTKTCTAGTVFCDEWGGPIYCSADCLAYMEKGGMALGACDSVCV